HPRSFRKNAAAFVKLGVVLRRSPDASAARILPVVLRETQQRTAPPNAVRNKFPPLLLDQQNLQRHLTRPSFRHRRNVSPRSDRQGRGCARRNARHSLVNLSKGSRRQSFLSASKCFACLPHVGRSTQT